MKRAFLWLGLIVGLICSAGWGAILLFAPKPGGEIDILLSQLFLAFGVLLTVACAFALVLARPRKNGAGD
jgi:hypothetical protein